MKKSIFSFMLALALALSCAGVCFADDVYLSQYFTEVADSSVEVAVDNSAHTVIINKLAYRNNQSAQMTVPQSSISGHLSYELTSDSVNRSYEIVNFGSASSITSISVTNISGCSLSQGGTVTILPDTNSGSFDFEVTYNNTSSHFGLRSGNTTGQSSITFTFDSLVVNGVNVVSSIIGEVVDFSLSPGYAFVIDGPCEIVERSYYINNSWDFTKNGNMRVNGAFENDLSATYIRDGYSPDLAYSRDDLIQWEALNANIVGFASNYEAYNSTSVQITQGQTYVIGYPQLYGFGTSNSRLLYTNSVNLVGHVYINYSERPTFRFVAIESLSEFTNTGDFYTYSVFRPAVADVSGDVTSGSGGVVITPSAPLPSGGGNTGQPPVDEDGSLLGTISRFVNDIKRLLSSAVEAINTLVNDGSSFMQSIGAMFTWLPAPIYGLLISAFTVLVVVGVLKTLWR